VIAHRIEEHGGAEEALREALAIRREAFGDPHPRIATSLNNLAAVLLARGGRRSRRRCSRRV
jgi:hypothetical protein